MDVFLWLKKLFCLLASQPMIRVETFPRTRDCISLLRDLPPSKESRSDKSLITVSVISQPLSFLEMWVPSLPDERAQWSLHCTGLLWAFPTHIAASQLFHSLQGPAFTRVGLNFAACSKVKGKLASIAWKYKGFKNKQPFSTIWQQQIGQGFPEPLWDTRGEISCWKDHQPTPLSGNLNKPHTAEFVVMWQLFSPFGAPTIHVIDALLPLDHSSSILSNSCKP